LKILLSKDTILDLPDKLFNLIEFYIPSSKIGDPNYWSILEPCDIKYFKNGCLLSVYNNNFSHLYDNFHLATRFIVDRQPINNFWNIFEKTMYLL